MTRDEILKRNSPKKHKISNSYGAYDAYKYIRKNKWKEIGHSVTEHDFYAVLRTMNNHLADLLSSGYDIQLPHRMGRLELRKFNTSIKIVDGKVVNNLPIDWDKTLKLWEEDEEEYNKRTLVKMQEKEIFKVYYNRGKASYVNKGYFSFRTNRELKKKLKNKIKEGQVDAYNLDND